jgi:hypothetical protein
MSGVNTPLRGLTIGEQRKRAAALRARHLTYGEIAALMGVSVIRARDLCSQQERIEKLGAGTVLSLDLSRRAITALLTGKHARQFGRDFQTRLPHLEDIAASYTRQDFLAEEFVGETTCREVETWLASKDRAFRTRPDTKTRQANRAAPALQVPPTEAAASLHSRKVPANRRIRRINSSAEAGGRDAGA